MPTRAGPTQLDYPVRPRRPPRPEPRRLAALPRIRLEAGRIRLEAGGIRLEAGGVGRQASLIERGARGRRLRAVGRRRQAAGPGRVGGEPGHGEREQLVQGCPLTRREGLEQVVLDGCELGVGLRELLGPGYRHLDDVPPAVGRIAAPGDETAFLELVEEADDVAGV